MEKDPTPQAGEKYQRLEDKCTKTILQTKRRAWDSHTSSLSFSSSTKRTWDFLHCMEGRKRTHSIPLCPNPQNLLDGQQKPEALAKHYHTQLGAPPNAPPTSRPK
ncbi:hypothetical protein E2C01_097926 [Portunus trituberculatus]|uniref:Uncharacterized protein n=1 Tax=Portunus trituberculatus TaxID=210409 RepID=A0A5B7KAU0_PORTR|nr:hypothetical protein [Portunus trituberculatus]